MIPEPSVASRERRIGSLLHYICGRPLEGNGKTVHIFPEPEEKLRKKGGNKGHHNVPEEEGGYNVEKPVKGSVSFPEIRGVLM